MRSLWCLRDPKSGVLTFWLPPNSTAPRRGDDKDGPGPVGQVSLRAFIIIKLMVHCHSTAIASYASNRPRDDIGTYLDRCISLLLAGSCHATGVEQQNHRMCSSRKFQPLVRHQQRILRRLVLHGRPSAELWMCNTRRFIYLKLESQKLVWRPIVRMPSI